MRIQTAALTFVVALMPACGGRVGDDTVRSAGGTFSRGGASSIGGTSNSSGIAGSGIAGSGIAGSGIAGSGSAGGTPGDAGPGSPGGTSSIGGAATTGDRPSRGGAGGEGAGATAACVDPSACGGDLIGTWAVVSSCLNVDGQLDLSLLGLDCRTAAVTGRHQVTGTWSAHADGSYADNTTTTGQDQIQVNGDCLVLSGVQITCESFGQVLAALGYLSTACTAAPRGGCLCSARIQQSGGLGLVSPDPATSGTFSPSGNVVELDAGAQYSYCVSRDRLTATPKTVSATTSGAIEMELVVP